MSRFIRGHISVWLCVVLCILMFSIGLTIRNYYNYNSDESCHTLCDKFSTYRAVSGACYCAENEDNFIMFQKIQPGQ